MSQPMLTVSSANAGQKKAQVNLLPCRIHHDGHVDTIEPYWTPTDSNEGVKVAYLRGRKLHGKTVQLPEGYYGSVAEKGETKREAPPSDSMEGDVDVEELPEPVEIAPLSSQATFDNLIIWGHEATTDSAADPYARSVEEWVSLSEQLHSYDSPATTS